MFIHSSVYKAGAFRAALCALLFCNAAFAIPIRWTGAGGRAGGPSGQFYDWHNKENWNPKQIPTAADDVVIDAGSSSKAIKITKDAAAKSLRIDQDWQIHLVAGTLSLSKLQCVGFADIIGRDGPVDLPAPDNVPKERNGILKFVSPSAPSPGTAICEMANLISFGNVEIAEGCSLTIGFTDNVTILKNLVNNGTLTISVGHHNKKNFIVEGNYSGHGTLATNPSAKIDWIQFKGNVDFSKGSFNANGKGVSLNGSAAQKLKVNPADTEFHILEFKNSGGGITVEESTGTLKAAEFWTTTGDVTVKAPVAVKTLKHKSGGQLTFEKKATVDRSFEDRGLSGALAFKSGANFSFANQTIFQSSHMVTLAGDCTFTGGMKRQGGGVTLGADGTGCTLSGEGHALLFENTAATVSLAAPSTVKNTGSALVTFGGKITTGAHELTVETGTPAKFDGGFAPGARLLLKGDGEIKGDNTFDSFKVDNSQASVATSVKFERGKTQTIKNAFGDGALDFRGKDDARRLTLEALGPGTAKWKVYFPNKPKYGNFSFVTVKDSKSVKVNAGTEAAYPLKLLPIAKHIKDNSYNPPSTEDWFSYEFVWRGGSSSAWTEKSNWKHVADGSDIEPDGLPHYTGHSDDIVIDTADGGHDLELGNGIGSSVTSVLELQSLTIKDGKRIKLGACKIHATRAISNEGTVALYGNQAGATLPVLESVAANSVTHAAGSAIEYYGDMNGSDVLAATMPSTSAPYAYRALKVTKTDSATMTFTHAVTADELDASAMPETTVVQLSGGSVTTTGAQTYGGPVELGANATLTASALTFAGTVNGAKALTIAGATPHTFGGTVGGTNPLTSLTTGTGVSTLNGGLITTTGAQTYGGRVELGADATLTGSLVTFTGTVDGAKTLTLGGATAQTFGGIVGGTTALTSLTTGTGLSQINGGSVTTTGAQEYTGAVTLGADATLTGSLVTFAGAVDGAKALTMADATAQTFGGIVGGTTALTSLTTGTGLSQINGGRIKTADTQKYGGAVELGADTVIETVNEAVVTFSGTVNSFGSGTNEHTLTIGGKAKPEFAGEVGTGAKGLAALTVNADLETRINTERINTSGAQRYGGAVELAENATLTATADSVTFAKTLDGPFALTVEGHTAQTFGGIVGGTTALTSLTTGTGLSQINGGRIKTADTQKYGGAVELGADTVIETVNEAVVTFSGTVNSFGSGTNEHTLTIGGKAKPEFAGEVGTGAKGLAALTTGADTKTTVNTAAIKTTGAQSYGGTAALTADATVTASAVTFAKTLDGPKALTVSGAALQTFGGEVGGTVRLASLTTGAGLSAINGGSVKTAGAQRYGGAVELGKNTTIEAESAAAVRFGGTVNSKSGGTDEYTLTIEGKAMPEFAGEVGTGVKGLAALTTGADTKTTVNTAAIKTSGAQNYGGAAALTADTTVTASAVTFAKTLDGPKSLTVSGAAPQTFGGEVGGATPLASLTTGTGASALNGGLVKTTGAQTYGGAVSTGAHGVTAETGALAKFDGGFTPDARLLLKGNAEIKGGNTFSSFRIDNSQAAAATSVKFEGGKTQTIKNAFGASDIDFKGKDGTNRLTLEALGTGTWNVHFPNKPKYKNFSFVTIKDSKSVDGAGTAGHPLKLPQLLAHAKDDQYNPPSTDDWFSYEFVWRGTVDTEWTQKGNWRYADSGDVELDSGPHYTGHTDAIVIDTADGGHDLDLGNGIGSPATSVLQLQSLTVKAGKRIGLGACKIHSAKAITNEGTVALYGNQTGATLPVLVSDSNSVTHAAASAIEYYGTVDGSDALAVTMPPAPAPYAYRALKVTKTGAGKMTFSRAVRADELDASAMAATAAVQLSGGSVETTGAQTYGGRVELGADATLTGSLVRFAGTVNGAKALTIAGTTPQTFGGAVGGTAPLASLTTGTGASAINGGLIKTSGVQTYGGRVELGADATLTGSRVTFTGTVDGAKALTMAGATAQTFGGIVGGTNPLASLTTGTGVSTLNGGLITTTGMQAYKGAVQLGADATLTGSLVTFAGAVDGAKALTLGGATAQTFGGVVGGTTALTSLTTGTGVSTLNGGLITTTGMQAYKGAVRLGADATLTGLLVTFAGTVDGAQALTMAGATAQTFGGAVGGTNPLTSLTTGTGISALNGGAIRTSGAQAYKGAVTLGADATLTGSLVTFEKTVDGAKALTLTGATAQTFGGIVGGANPPASLTTGAGVSTLNGGLIKTAGAQTYAGATALGKNATIETVNAAPVTFEGTVDSIGAAEYALTVTGKARPEFKGDAGFGAKGLSTLTTGAETQTTINTARMKTTGAQRYGGSVRLARDATLTATLVTFAKTVDGAKALTLAGATAQTFGGIVGGMDALTSLTTGTGLSALNGGAIKTTGTQSYKGAVTLGADATLTGSLVTFEKTVDGVKALTLAGATAQTFSGIVGGTTALTSLTTGAGVSAINGGVIKTTGTQSYKGAVTLGADATLTGSLVTFEKTVDGAKALTLAGATAQTFGGIVGGATALTSLTTGTGVSALNGGVIKTTGVQSYKGAVTLGADAALMGSLVTFEKTVDGAKALTMTGGTAQTFGGIVGGTAALASLTTGTGESAINGGAIKTTGVQEYKGAVALGADTELRASDADDGGVIRFHALVKDNGSHALSVETFRSYVEIKGGGFVTGGTQRFKASRGVRFMAGADGVWSAGGDGISLDAETTDLYAGCAADGIKVTLGSALSCRSFYFYRGKFFVGGRKITAAEDFAVWGAAYNADDPRYSGADTRFAFYVEPAGDLRALLADTLTLAPAYGASFENLSGAAFTVGRNFYINGADLNAASLTLTLRDNGSAKPIFNPSPAVTERQWGVPYAAAFNMTAKNVKASHWVAAGGARIQNVTDGGGNAKWQFAVPKLTAARTVYDDVVYVQFDADVENSNGEIAAALAFGGSALKNGGVWYNGGALSMGEIAYADADCAKPLANRDIPAADGFYLKIKTSGGTWNTDATGTFAYRGEDSTNPSDSTDRSGRHRDVKVDLSFLEGVFTAAAGHTMCVNYGIGLEGGAAAASFTDVRDGCAPVLIEVCTGQEAHTAPSGSASMANYGADAQKPYDAHNFIEFRYSEPVNTGAIALSGRADERKTINIPVSASFGAVSGKAPLKVSGIAEIKDGALQASSATAHALYRKFSRDGTAAPAFESHRLRLSIAGFADKTVSVGGKSYFNWAGYIDEAETPRGGVTPIGGNAVSDAAGNGVDGAGAANHRLPSLQVNARAEGVYGSWDVLPPVFATLSGKDTGAFEAVGNASAGASGLERVEFHVFDNAQNDAGWHIKFGWSKDGGKTLVVNDAYGADVFGGSRPFAAGARRTAGGIRYSTLYNKAPHFKYALGKESAPDIPCREEIVTGAKSPIFLPAEGSARRTMTAHDGLYFSVTLADSSLPFKSVLAVAYDEGGCITDLAGNRMKGQKIHTVDRTPPSFAMTVGAVRDGEKSEGVFKELYIVFNKQLKESNVGKMYRSLRFVENAAPYTVRDLKATASRLKFRSETQTGIIVTLNRPISLQDMLKTYVQCYVETPSEDPVSGLLGAYVSEIRDDLGNYLPRYSAHALSDFAVNAVEAVYAYDGRQAPSSAESADLSHGLAVRNWDADAGRESTLMTEQDIFIYAQMRTGAADGDKVNRQVEAHFDVVSKLEPNAVSENYNRNKSDVADWRIWLPAKSFEQPVSPFPALAGSVNANTQSVLQSRSAYKGDGKPFSFTLPYEGSVGKGMKGADWKSGDQIVFLFGLADREGKALTIVHSPEWDGSAYSGRPDPLFALRLRSGGDLSGIDLWSFNLRERIRQRGGVSIQGNVIDRTGGGKVMIEVETSGSGDLDVIVMTLDGDVVRYLHHGQSDGGRQYFSWDGHSSGGKPVARGLYFIRVFGKGIDETRKVMVVGE